VPTIAHVLGSASVFDWTICGCVSLVLTTVWIFRTTARQFGWGPRDT
jgi:hypothetical protein